MSTVQTWTHAPAAPRTARANPYAALTQKLHPDDLLRMLVEPETQRSTAYWATIAGCLMIIVSCLAVFALAAAQR